MATVFRKKKKFQRKYKIFDTKKDFDMQQSHKVAFAEDPSREVVFGIFEIASLKPANFDEMTEEDSAEIDERWYHYMSEIIIDTDIEGLDFSTPDSTRESFNDPSVDWTFFIELVARYVGNLMETHHTLGKVLRAMNEEADSGEEE